MAADMFLAMTGAEIEKSEEIPEKTAWMACHFSPYSTGLSNLPRMLPEGSFLILNDLAPMHGHDPVRIWQELAACVDTFRCCGLLLDFQREGYPDILNLIITLLQGLPCPVVVSDLYARDFDCPVFLPPVPPSCTLQSHIDPWQDRKIWLEIGTDGEEIVLTESGTTVTSLPRFAVPDAGFSEEKLHCHYSIDVTEHATFTLWRTKEDLAALIEEAETNGVAGMIGLYQEFHSLAI